MDLFLSPAYRDLTGAQKDILTYIYMHVELKTSNTGKTKHVVTNRKSLVVPYKDIAGYLGYSEHTVWEAFKKFLANGFLGVIENGGGRKGDCKIYEVTEDWRQWQPGKVFREIGQNGKVGWQKKNKRNQGSSDKRNQGSSTQQKNP